jgi:hypothetical protein
MGGELSALWILEPYPANVQVHDVGETGDLSWPFASAEQLVPGSIFPIDLAIKIRRTAGQRSNIAFTEVISPSSALSKASSSQAMSLLMSLFRALCMLAIPETREAMYEPGNYETHLCW